MSVARKESEFNYVPLSEKYVVTTQIKNRWKQDESFYPLEEETSNPLISNGVFPFSESVLCTYIDLDILIDSCGLTQYEKLIIKLIMRGHSAPDIAEKYQCSPKTVNKYLNIAIDKIIQKNNENWKLYSQNIKSLGKVLYERNADDVSL